MSSPRDRVLADVLRVMPPEWLGTTFKNKELLGRERWSADLEALLMKCVAEGSALTSRDLEDLGNAEDYLRVASNVSTLLEHELARKHSLPIAQVFSFTSTPIAILSIAMACERPLCVVGAGGDLSSSIAAIDKYVAAFGKSVRSQPDFPSDISGGEGAIVVALTHDHMSRAQACVVDGILFITNAEAVPPSAVLVMRKRMATPMTTPHCMQCLQSIVRGEQILPASPPQPHDSDVRALNEHMQIMCGASPQPSNPPVFSTSGLAALAALWMSIVQDGGADVIMCSTAYGGSSQLTDIISQSPRLRKTTFHIAGGGNNIDNEIKSALDQVLQDDSAPSRAAADVLPLTVVFVEIPTNPDMKVPSIPALAAMLKDFTERSGRRVLLLVDTTFTPASGVMKSLADTYSELAVMCFVSLSKSVSRGMTTAGALVANDTPSAVALLGCARQAARHMGTLATGDQMSILCREHTGVEARCHAAYNNALAVGSSLCGAVEAASGARMALAHVSEEQAAAGFPSSTFSFNLPPPEGNTREENEALAQAFVDELCEHKEWFKPCVSFGQDNNLVYCTVPSTSTQGAIKAEDKAKQAVGGVQLVRLSFPPSLPLPSVQSAVVAAVNRIYAKKEK